MPIAHNSYIRRTLALLFFGLIALLGIAGTSVWLAQESDRHFEDVVASRHMRLATGDLLSLVQDAETGQRGFLISENREFLEPYNSAALRFQDTLSKVDDLLGERDDVRQKIDTILRAKMDELHQSVALAEKGDFTQARDILKNRRGKLLMDQARSNLAAVLNDSETKLAAATTAQRENTRNLRLVTLVGSIVIILVIAGALITTLQYLRELTAARVLLQDMNLSLEERVQVRTQDLIRANEEVQRFAYIVTHDLRAPLVNVMGFTAELETTLKTIQDYVLAEGEVRESVVRDARAAAEEDLPEAIGFIRSSTRKMDGLINAILKISRDGRRPLNREKIDLKELAQSTAEALHHQVSENGGEIAIGAGLPAIISDRLSLEQIFSNLFDNASKYSAPDRPLAVKVSGERNSNGDVVISVADNGRGITDVDHQRIFDLFRRSGVQDKPGEGIGLAHVRSLVRNLGGDIAVASSLGQGTTFRITLPTDIKNLPRSI